MAIYIQIQKISETDDAAHYSFGDDGGPHGILELDKRSGQVSLIQPLFGDAEEVYYRRAARKIGQHFARGEFPDVTCWAS